MKQIGFGIAFAVIFGVGCGPTQSASEGAARRCGNPASGQRYALCLDSSSGLAQATLGKKTTLGTVGAVQNSAAGTRYTLVGGTFHENK